MVVLFEQAGRTRHPKPRVMIKKQPRLTEAEHLARAIRRQELERAERAEQEARNKAFLRTAWWFDQSLIDG